MKYYDKSMYQTEQHVRIIVTILIAFIIGFLIVTIIFTCCSV